MQFFHDFCGFQQTRIAVEFVAEQMKRSQSFLGFVEEFFIGLEMVESDGIGDVVDGDAGLGKLLSPENVLVAVLPESLV